MRILGGDIGGLMVDTNIRRTGTGEKERKHDGNVDYLAHDAEHDDGVT